MSTSSASKSPPPVVQPVPAPTVWLLAVPSNPEFANPAALRPYGLVRPIFRPRETASHSPEESFARLYDAFADFRANDMIAWMGGDTLIAILAGRALEARGVNDWVWLRYIGRDEYQRIPIRSDGFGPMTDVL